MNLREQVAQLKALADKPYPLATYMFSIQGPQTIRALLGLIEEAQELITDVACDPNCDTQLAQAWLAKLGKEVE